MSGETLETLAQQCPQSWVLTVIVYRPKRSLAEFQAELDSCSPGSCTVIKCTVGPLEKDESVLFKVRSRLFTETQVKVCTKLLNYFTMLCFYISLS